MINKNGAAKRRDVLFINADREFKEGKNRNSLRAEDIEKIAQVYRTRQNLEKYSRVVSFEELEKEEFNLNIRRYVDNSPPPEPHDVRAHLHGGIPVAEIDSLTDFFTNYDGVKDAIFAGWAFLPDAPSSHSTTTSKTKRKDGQECPSYCNFTPAITTKDQIKTSIESAPGLQTKHAAFQKAIAGWWKKNLAEIERLPETKNVFELRRHCIDSLAKTLTSQGILTGHQVRGSVAGYIKALESDLQSIAASGWGAELIPEEQILQSQFPEVLAQIERDQTRIAELEGLFAAANETDEEDADLENVDTENGVLPKALVKALKDERKLLAGEVKEAKRLAKTEQRKETGRAATLTRSASEVTEVPASLALRVGISLTATAEKRIAEIDQQLERHAALDAELKKLKANIREVEKQKDEMIAVARAKFTEDEAKTLILERFRNLLTEQFDG